MTTTRQLAANRANALKSTGPRTPAGKARAAANALAAGLHAKLAVLPALGETADGLVAFQTSAVKALGARGPVERALAHRVAGLLWRQRRVAVAEAAAVARAAAPLPPDPAAVAAAGIHFVRELPAAAPPHARLAFARTWLHAYRNHAAEVEAALTAIEPQAAADTVVGWAVAKTVLAAAADELQWDVRADGLGPWAGILADLGAPADQTTWTLGLIRDAVRAAAARVGRGGETLWTNTATRLAAAAANYRKKVTEFETDEAQWVAAMDGDRQRAAAAALFADAKLQDAIARQEAHLGRELARALATLEQVQKLRPRAADPRGFVLERLTAGGGRNGFPELAAGTAR